MTDKTDEKRTSPKDENNTYENTESAGASGITNADKTTKRGAIGYEVSSPNKIVAEHEELSWITSYIEKGTMASLKQREDDAIENWRIYYTERARAIARRKRVERLEENLRCLTMSEHAGDIGRKMNEEESRRERE